MAMVETPVGIFGGKNANAGWQDNLFHWCIGWRVPPYAPMHSPPYAPMEQVGGQIVCVCVWGGGIGTR